jgi:hypothetical protein
MPSTYSPDLRLELMANGEKTGTWGSITNVNLGTILEDAISGLVTVITTNEKQALTVVDGNTDQARCAAVNVSSTFAGNFEVYVPPVTKLYVFINSDNEHFASIYASTSPGNTTPAGVGVIVPPGKSVLLRCDGINIVEQVNYFAGNVEIGGNFTVNGDFNTGGAPIPVPEGGTGVATLTGVVYGNGTSPFTAATGTQITTAIGANFVTNATNATNATTAVTATTATSAGTITNAGGWSIELVGTKLYFDYNGTNVASLDSSGNLICLGNVTGFGTP